MLIAASSLALVSGGVWVAQHATSNLAFYNMSSHEWSQFPTSPVNYEETTLPYFVAANGSTVWFNEHYANRLAKIDTARGLLTEYSLSDPPASNITSIGNALTFALGKDKVWFTELTANQVGYLDASYQPNFTISPPNISNIKLKPGESVNVTFTINGQSAKPLTIQFADTENYTSRPQKIVMNATQTEIRSLTSQDVFVVTITTDKTLQPGNYTLLVTVTDQLTYQGTYIKLQTTT
jgi:streptogramin lyase